MTDDTRLQIRELERSEIDAILQRNHVGRVAFCVRDYASVEPIRYVYDGDERIYGRTSPGVKLAAVGQNADVAFEVDEIDALYAWRSVIVHGRFLPLVQHAPGWTREAWDQAVTMLRRLDPDIFTASDPAPHRDVVFRIAIREVAGRAACPPGTGAG